MNKKYAFKTLKRLFKIVTILMIKNKLNNITKLLLNYKFTKPFY